MSARSPLRPDVRAFARNTGWAYFPLAFLGRLPFAMMIVGVLTLVTTTRGSVAEAGLAAAFTGVGTAVCGPLAGTIADRSSQRAVLIGASAVSILAAAGLLAVLAASAHLAVVCVLAFLLGGATPQVSPFSRSRLAALALRAGSPELRSRATSLVMSYESVVDEASFVLGPVVVGVLTALIAPWAPLVLGAALSATVVIAFALHPTGRAATHPDARPPAGRAITGAVLMLAAAMLLVGGIFGSILTALTGFMEARGLGGQSGIVYGAMSAGAILVAVGVAALPERFTLNARWAVLGAIAVLGSVVLTTAASIPGAVLGLFLCGTGVGAVLVSLFSLGERAAPHGRTTTVLTTLQSTLVVGQALALAGCGALVQARGAGAGYAVTIALAVALVALALVAWWRSRPSRG
ncbi:MAG: MFS transporter [Actinobacteria bacterium]|nr:MFS transporter [Actinomycetota bacterium]